MGRVNIRWGFYQCAAWSDFENLDLTIEIKFALAGKLVNNPALVNQKQNISMEWNRSYHSNSLYCYIYIINYESKYVFECILQKKRIHVWTYIIYKLCKFTIVVKSDIWVLNLISDLTLHNLT